MDQQKMALIITALQSPRIMKGNGVDGFGSSGLMGEGEEAIEVSKNHDTKFPAPPNPNRYIMLLYSDKITLGFLLRGSHFHLLRS
jgi:hypothetical protein